MIYVPESVQLTPDVAPEKALFPVWRSPPSNVGLGHAVAVDYQSMKCEKEGILKFLPHCIRPAVRNFKVLNFRYGHFQDRVDASLR